MHQQSGLALLDPGADAAHECAALCNRDRICGGFTLRQGVGAVVCTRLKETAGFHSFENTTLALDNYRASS